MKSETVQYFFNRGLKFCDFSHLSLDFASQSKGVGPMSHGVLNENKNHEYCITRCIPFLKQYQIHVPYILFEDTLVWVFLSNAQVFMLSLIVKEELI